jgi:colanic acid/amylovoran biosynthesis glycosyltransferase
VAKFRVAYFVNQYPKVSHSFIRREILALERQGFEIQRISIRGWDAELVDEEDVLERQQTRYVLEGGIATLVLATLKVMVTKPIRFLVALRLTLKMGMKADRPWPFHLIYLTEACRIIPWLKEFGAQHVHAHFGTNSAEIAMLAHVLGGPKYSFTVHGPDEFDKPQFLGIGEKIRRSAFVVAISSYGRSQLYRWVDHAHWPKVRVVHCGLESAFHEVDRSPPLPKPRLVCVGRLCEAKGQLLLIEAVHRLAQKGIRFELVLAGEGEMRPDLEYQNKSVLPAGSAAVRYVKNFWLRAEWYYRVLPRDCQS